MLNQLTQRNAAFVIAAIAFATIAGAWIFQAVGYTPCPLCLMQRWAYYATVPLSLVIATSAKPGSAMARYGLVLLGLIWIGSAIFGAFHAGVEWKFWPGPQTCGGDIGGGLPDLSKPVISCNEAAIRILGLSLAGWNAVISAALAWISFAAARKSA